MPRGGRRRGRPGASYAQRTDLNAGPRTLPVQAAPSQGYGERVAQERAQQAVPMAPAPGPPPVAAGAAPAGPIALPPALDAPTGRPDEPVTAGSPTGPGPGPEALNLAAPDEAEADELRAIYRMFPTEGLRELIEDYDEGVL